MPVIRSRDAAKEAVEIFSKIEVDHSLTCIAEVGTLTVRAHYCDKHHVIEFLVRSSDDVIGFGTLESAADLARVLDALICVEEMMNNLAKRFMESVGRMPSDKPLHA